MISTNDFGRTLETHGGHAAVDFGRGIWGRATRKRTVEECIVLPIREIQSQLHLTTCTLHHLEYPDAERVTVYCRIVATGVLPVVHVGYRLGDDLITLPVRIQATLANLGGCRMWFTCPLTVGGIPCRRRTTKLYLPPGGRYFGCRQCHSLTYRSCQMAHWNERQEAARQFRS